MCDQVKSLPRQYQVILDSIADGVYTVDLNWRVTFFNKAAESITGIPRQDAIGQPCFEVFRSNICENDCLLKRAINAQKSIPNRPIYIIRADKRRIPINVTTAILKNADNQMELIVSQKIEVDQSNTDLYLKIATHGNVCSFLYSFDLKTWNLLKENVDASFLSTKMAGGFVGCFYALYATSLGQSSTNIAHFDWFEYQGNDEVYK